MLFGGFLASFAGNFRGCCVWVLRVSENGEEEEGTRVWVGSTKGKRNGLGRNGLGYIWNWISGWAEDLRWKRDFWGWI